MTPKKRPPTLRTKDDVVAAFAERLRDLRQQSGLSQERLAEAADLHWTSISQIERAQRGVNLVTLLRLAHGLGVEPGELVNGIEPPTEPDSRTRGT